MALNIPIHKKRIPFLDRQGVKYSFVEQTEPQPEGLESIVRIWLELTAINVMDYGIAMHKAGVSEQLQCRSHTRFLVYEIKPDAAKELWIESGCP